MYLPTLLSPMSMPSLSSSPWMRACETALKQSAVRWMTTSLNPLR